MPLQATGAASEAAAGDAQLLPSSGARQHPVPRPHVLGQRGLPACEGRRAPHVAHRRPAAPLAGAVSLSTLRISRRNLTQTLSMQHVDRTQQSAGSPNPGTCFRPAQAVSHVSDPYPNANPDRDSDPDPNPTPKLDPARVVHR